MFNKYLIILVFLVYGCSVKKLPTTELNKNVDISISDINYKNGIIYFKIVNNNNSDIFIRQNNIVMYSSLTYKSGRNAKEVKKIHSRVLTGFQEFVFIKRNSYKDLRYITSFFLKFELEKDSIYTYKSTYSSLIVKKNSQIKTLTGEIPSGNFTFKFKN